MTESIHPVASDHLPSFITAPGETDVLMVVMGMTGPLACIRPAAPPPTHLMMMLVRVGVLVTTVHVHFQHHFLMRLGSAPYEALVFVRCEFRHFTEERHDIPQQFIIVRDAPGRHARHFDPMFYDPKLFR